jgi:hypothetical protein
MSNQEFKRLQNFIRDHKVRVKSWNGFFNLHKSYADKMGISEFQKISVLSDTKSEVFKHPAEHIKDVSLWVVNYVKQVVYF